MPFMLVFRPHQRRAWAEKFDDEQEVVRLWLNGMYNSGCGCRPGEASSLDYDGAIEDLGRDMSRLTRLDNAEECQRYLTDPDYAGRHNKGLDDVISIARSLGWVDEDEEEGDLE